MKNLFLTCACLLALLVSPLRLVAGEPSVVIVRIQDSGGNIAMALTGPNGRTELLEFKASTMTQKGLQASSQGYYTVIDKLYKKATN